MYVIFKIAERLGDTFFLGNSPKPLREGYGSGLGFQGGDLGIVRK